MAYIKQPYAFGRLDQLDFQFEFQFPAGDTDSVASFTVDGDAALQFLSPVRSGNVVTVTVALASGAVVADYQLLSFSCHMVGSTSPPRKLSPSITLQIKPL